MADDTISEEWRSVEGWPYEVSSFGRVRRTGKARGTAREVLTQWPANSYLLVTFSMKNKRTAHLVHRLVCVAFNGPAPSPFHEVAHYDGDRSNNRADNLRWATRTENHADKIRHDTHRRGERTPGVILTTENVVAIRELFAKGYSNTEIAKQFDVAYRTIYDIKIGRSWAWLR